MGGIAASVVGRGMDGWIITIIIISVMIIDLQRAVVEAIVHSIVADSGQSLSCLVLILSFPFSFLLLFLSSSHVRIMVGEWHYAWSPLVSPLGRNARGFLRGLGVESFLPIACGRYCWVESLGLGDYRVSRWHSGHESWIMGWTGDNHSNCICHAISMEILGAEDVVGDR